MNPSIATPTFPTVSPAPALSLFIYPTWTRDSWRAAGGPELPAEDLARPFKSWKADDAQGDPTDIWLYRALDPGGVARTIQIKDMSIAEAQSLNLPGVPSYPAWKIAPTDATRGGQPISPMYMATLQQANDLIAALNSVAGGVVCSGLIDEQNDGDIGNATDPFVYPPDENRRQFIFWFKKPGDVNPNHAEVVGLLLAEQYREGIGAPGYWNVAGSSPVWVSTMPKGNGVNPNPPRPQPVRQLLATESLILGGGLPPVVELVNSALPPAVVGSGPAGADGYSAADRALLQRIAAAVKA